MSNYKAIEILNPYMDTISLLKERMGYIDKLRCCIDCKKYNKEEQVCKISNMGDIPVKPTATCSYYQRADHIPPSIGDLIYQYKIKGMENWTTIEKSWYENLHDATNIDKQILTQE